MAKPKASYMLTSRMFVKEVICYSLFVSSHEVSLSQAAALRRPSDHRSANTESSAIRPRLTDGDPGKHLRSHSKDPSIHLVGADELQSPAASF
jgi:hypothetical protein